MLTPVRVQDLKDLLPCLAHVLICILFLFRQFQRVSLSSRSC